MDENKNLENLEEVAEEVTETVEDVVEEVVEEVAEEVAEVTEEITEAAEEVTEEVAEVAEEVVEEINEIVDTPKKGKAGAVIAVILVVAIVAACVWFFIPKNKYNRMGYVDISGRTVQDMADQMGVSLEEFLAQYELPADMPADTTESAAYYNIPVRVMAQMFGMDYATMKETLHFPETVTEDTTWGEAEGAVLLRDYIGEENLDSFKEQYGLGEDVTADTQWKDVRNIVDNAQREMRLEQEKAMAEAEDAAAVESEEVEAGAGEAEEAPAEAEETPAE